MKKLKLLLLLLCAFICINSFCYGGERGGREVKSVLYTGFVNIVPDGFNIPLIGFVNLAYGSHRSVHVGFYNWNQYDFSGVQVGYVNTVGGRANAVQVGFLNTAGRGMSGVQVGFVNTAVRKSNGVQVGFLNTIAGETMGVQAGFVNTVASNYNGIQTGFVNTVSGRVMGIQSGFINTAAGGINGIQYGFINTTNSLTGLQIGFINLSNTVDEGLPIGFISVVKKEGFHALELSMTELFPVNLSYKIGLRKLYSTISLSYAPDLKENYAGGFGFGSIIPVNEILFVNPEVAAHNTINDKNDLIISLAVNMGYHITPRLVFLIGPSVAWNRTDVRGDFIKPFFPLFEHEINDKNNLIIGFRTALRFNIRKG